MKKPKTDLVEVPETIVRLQCALDLNASDPSSVSKTALGRWAHDHGYMTARKRTPDGPARVFRAPAAVADSAPKAVLARIFNLSFSNLPWNVCLSFSSSPEPVPDCVLVGVLGGNDDNSVSFSPFPGAFSSFIENYKSLGGREKEKEVIQEKDKEVYNNIYTYIKGYIYLNFKVFISTFFMFSSSYVLYFLYFLNGYANATPKNKGKYNTSESVVSKGQKWPLLDGNFGNSEANAFFLLLKEGVRVIMGYVSRYAAGLWGGVQTVHPGGGELALAAQPGPAAPEPAAEPSPSPAEKPVPSQKKKKEPKKKAQPAASAFGGLEPVQLRPVEEVFAMEQERAEELRDKPYYNMSDVQRMKTDVEYAAGNAYRLLVYSLYDTLAVWYEPDEKTDENGNLVPADEPFDADGHIVDSQEFTTRILREAYQMVQQWIEDGGIAMSEGQAVPVGELELPGFQEFRDMLDWPLIKNGRREGYLVSPDRIRDMEKSLKSMGVSGARSSMEEDLAFQNRLWTAGERAADSLTRYERIAYDIMKRWMKYDGTAMKAKEFQKIGPREMERQVAEWKAKGWDDMDIKKIVCDESFYSMRYLTLHGRMFSASQVDYWNKAEGLRSEISEA